MKDGSLLIAIALGVSGCAAEATQTKSPETDNPTCPSIACNSGVAIKADLTLTVEETQQQTFEICVNDECTQGQFTAVLRGSGQGFQIVGAHGAGYLFFYYEADDRNWFEMQWNVQPEDRKQPGDRYRVTTFTNAGSAEVLFDESVDYEERTTAPLPCPLTCLGLDLDLRT